MKRRDKQRRNMCRRCPFFVPPSRCRNTTIRSGRCGDWVFYRLPGGKQCRRRWVRPKDPRTPAQVRNRANLAAASARYNDVLTEEERQAYIAAGARRRSRARLSQSGSLTGQQYAVRRELAKIAKARRQNTEIPAKVGAPQRVPRPTWERCQGATTVAPEQHQWRQNVECSLKKSVRVPQSSTKATSEPHKGANKAPTWGRKNGEGRMQNGRTGGKAAGS